MQTLSYFQCNTFWAQLVSKRCAMLLQTGHAMRVQMSLTCRCQAH